MPWPDDKPGTFHTAFVAVLTTPSSIYILVLLSLVSVGSLFVPVHGDVCILSPPVILFLSSSFHESRHYILGWPESSPTLQLQP